MNFDLLYHVSVLDRHMNFIINKRMEVCRKYELTDTQFRIMVLLINNPKLKQKNIMKQLDLSRATITSVLKNMINKGLLTKTKYNGKSYKITIADGVKTDFDGLKKEIDGYEKLVTEGLSKKDIEITVNVLKNAITRLAALNEVVLK